MEIQERQGAIDSKLDADMHPVLKKIYASRGVVDASDLRLELSEVHPPSLLKNSDTAAALLFQTMQRGKRILVVGDFDADGATSSALFLLCMKAMGYTEVGYLVPNRFEYGYGLTPEIVDVALQQSPDLIVTVDNGIASHEGINKANEQGVQVLVTDHHLPGNSLPDAECILNPNQLDCDFPSKALAGVGVVFYLMLALRSVLRENSWFEERGIKEPNMASFLDLVALGTVADVVPLDQNNRRLVKYGLSVIRSGKGRPGIRALLEVGGRNGASVVASDLGFVAGPRLNAAGRMDDMSLGIECLLADNPSAAKELAIQLDGFNKDRKQVEQDMQVQAMETLADLDVDANDRLGLCLYNTQWHQGVVGILASRIKEKFNRPCIVFADSGEKESGKESEKEGKKGDCKLIKGSARSISGLHIRDALDLLATRHPELLNRFGGHAMAAGLAIRETDFTAFAEAFENVLADTIEPEILNQVTWTDGELDVDCLTLDFASLIRDAGPWGQQFPEPVFQGDFNVASHRVVGEKHLKMTLESTNTSLLIDAIAFYVDAELLEQKLQTVSLVYRLEVNEFRGVCNPQLLVEKIIDYTAV
jgi:single-stranded-DNA-specific exonuclease